MVNSKIQHVDTIRKGSWCPWKSSSGERKTVLGMWREEFEVVPWESLVGEGVLQLLAVLGGEEDLLGRSTPGLGRPRGNEIK